MKIKICGITNLEDALAAVEEGADMLGFNFHPQSPRYVKPESCAAIINLMAARGVHATTVGVFVNSPLEEVSALLARCGLDLAQLHGDEPPKQLAALGDRAFKALRPATLEALVEAEQAYPENGRAPGFLVDAYQPGKYGGTGHPADWSLAREAARHRPILLAGGLSPETVEAAIREVRPWGVDVASGCEAAPGRKDRQKIAAFVRAVREGNEASRVTIVPAAVEDASEILALQKLAYRSEAELNGDFSIPPLTETLEEIRAEFGRLHFLKAVVDGRIVGSVRADAPQETCSIGRLIVHPDWQNQGIGRRLMQAIEASFEKVGRYELFTSERSRRNLALYQKLGYRPFRQERLNEHVNLVYLEKPARFQGWSS